MYTFAVVLLVMWLLGMASSLTMGGDIHLLLVLAVIVTLLRVFRVFQGPVPKPGRVERRLIPGQGTPQNLLRRASDTSLAA